MDVSKADGPVEADLGGEITAFAGVQAEASLGGTFQWLKPARTDWSDFAGIKASAAGQAGAGATAAFSISFAGGQFHVYAKAGACVGVGLKGGCEATVGAMQIAEFFLWYRHQVTNSLDRNIRYFVRDADFQRFCLIHALAIVSGESLVSVYSRIAYQAMSEADLHPRIGDYIRDNTEEALRRIETTTDEMLVALSTVKGYLLYRLDEVGRQLEARYWLLESQMDEALEQLEQSLRKVRAGISLVTGEGELDLQAQNDQIKIRSKDQLKLVSANAEVDLAAGKTVHLATQGGASLTIEDGNIVIACPGEIKVHAGKHSFVGPTQLSREMNVWPETRFDKRIHVVLPSGKPAKNYRYEIHRADGARIAGVTDGDGWADVQNAGGLDPHVFRLLGPAGEAST